MKSSYTSRLPGTPGIVVPQEHVNRLRFSRRFRHAKRFRLLPLVLALSAASLIAQPLPGHGACAPAGTDFADLIACSGTHTAAVNARAGDDNVIVSAGASVDVGNSNGATPTVAIDAGADNDTVTNLGAVSVTSTKAQAQSPVVPMPSPGISVTESDNFVSAAGIAVAGDSGNDTLDSRGTLAASASTTASTVSVPLTVQGGDTVIATTTVEARAIGISGDGGTDMVSNSGTLTTNAATEITSINAELNLIDGSHGNASTSAGAIAIGLISGDGAGSLTENSGTINSTAAARSLGVNVEINAADAATADSALTVASTAAGIHSGLGGGAIQNTGAISVSATSNVFEVGVNASYLDITIADRDVSDVSTTLEATATGIDAAPSAGTIAITHIGSIDALASSTVHAIAIALASEGVPAPTETLVTKFGIASAGIHANSHANGIVGGDVGDTINSSGTISAGANADSRQDSINVGMALVTYPIPTPGIVLGSAGTDAYAQATGLDGGAGDDAITNDNLVNANADASASALTVTVNLSGFTDNSAGSSGPTLGSLGASFAVADTTTQASATATGIQGGAGDDSVQNNDVVEAVAESDAGSIGVAATMNVEFKEGENLFSGNAAGARSVTQADTIAIGIDGGTGEDALINEGSITANAETDTNSVAVAITVAGTVRGKGGALNLAATDTSSIGNADAVGIYGGAGGDQITNSGDIVANADVDATAISGSLSVGFAKQGLVANVSLARSEAAVDSAATGISGGTGSDTLVNDGRIEAHADADTLAVAVAVSLSGTADGVSIAASVADASGDATATATGMDGGDDNDIVRNTSVIDISNVTADSLAASIAVELSGTNNGVAAGVSIADSSANATALATGLEGGAGNDQITNTNGITLQNINASTNAISIGVAMNASLNAGLAAGVAMTDASTHSSVVAKGISGGDGNDAILNTGTITATNNIDASSQTTVVSISANISMAGAALGVALTETSSNADTRITGIDGGAADDTIDNRAAITLHGTSDVGASSIGLSINAALGVGASAALVNAEANAATTVTGIDGGTGRNDISNTASLNLVSISDADALGVGIGGTLAFGADAALVDVNANATATAVAIDEAGSSMAGGMHGNIFNTGTIAIDASADVEGRAISGDLRGYALGETSITAIANGYGIRSGEGSTVIDNRGSINVISHAESTGLAVAVTLAGKAMADANSTADARGTGIAAGADDDQVQNSAAITIDANSYAEATAVAVDLAGTARTDVKTQALTTATGVDGGSGSDVLSNSANLTIGASSSTSAIGVQVSILGTTGSDVVNTPTSLATAIGAGDGDDSVFLSGANVRVTASSSADVSSSSWTVGGTSGSRAGVDATATSIGLDGGNGDDTLVQRSGALTVESTTHASAFSSGWTFAGSSGTEAALAAHTRSVGLDGGTGSDYLRNETAFTATSYSTLTTDGGGNTVFGNASTDTEIGADATTIGMAGGADNDRIENLAALTLNADSIVSSTRTAFTFAGGANIDELLKSKTTVIGLDGGSGDDVIYNEATITGASFAGAATNGSAKATLGGGTSASGKAVAESIATGIDGGSGADIIDNRGALSITAIIDPIANNSSSAGVFFGNGRVEGRINGTLDAAGIDAGDGDNEIANRANVTVTTSTTSGSVANTFASGSDFSFFTDGSAYAYSETRIEANATGIRAGNGNNTVLNASALSVHMENTVARAYTDPNGGATSGSGNATVDAVVSAWGRGIELGDGANVVINDGTIDLTINPHASAWSDADGTGLDNANSTTNGSAFGEAIGIRTGNGGSQIVSNGAIHVTAAPIAEAFSHGDGGLTFGDANGFANNYATGKAYGIVTGDGNNYVENNALLSVTATPSARAFNNDINVLSNGHGDGDADAFTYSRSMSEAIGIKTGIGTQTIVNTGTIDVSANAVATGGYHVSPGGGLNGHADSATTLYAEGRATGIWIGGGDVNIVNRGDITVTATPSAFTTREQGDGGPYRFTETFGVATGVDSSHGSGNQTLTNDGHITVTASGSAFGANDCCQFDPTSSRAGGAPVAVGVDFRSDGYKTVVNNGTIEATANISAFFPGDLTQAVFANAVQVVGDGATVVNNGTITAQEKFNGANLSAGYAIYLSSWRDQEVTVILGRNSVTNGDVLMYGGAATLALDGNPILNGTITNNTNRDFNLVLNNDGSFSHALPTVANVTKNGLGTYAMPALNTVRRITTNQGTLHLNSDYTFAPNGLFQTGIYADGSNGRFATDGVATLGGELRIVQGGGLYRHGMSFDVLTAAGGIAAGSSFSDIDLPAPTALVSFQSQQMADRVRISTDVRSIASVAGNGVAGNDLAIANYLDQIMNAGTGDFTGLFVTLQSETDPAQFADTFASLSPAAFSNGPTAALHSNQRFSNALLSCRVREGDNRFVAEGECGWGKVQGRKTKRDETANAASADETALEISGGVQKAINENWYAGFGLSYEDSELTTADLAMSDGERYQLGGILKAVYGGATFSLSLSGGQGRYDSSRNLTVPVPGTVATATQKIDFVSSHLRAGYAFGGESWYLRPLVDFGVSRTRLGAFTETGAGAANLSVQEQTESYVSVLPAVEFGTEWQQGDGTLIRPFASIGVTHYLSGTNPEITAILQGAPVGVAPFTVTGEMDETFGNLTLGLDFLGSDGKDVRVTYDGQFSDHTASHSFALKVSVPF